MNNSVKPEKYISPLGAWALAFGCAVGWGAFVMPGTTFLPLSGPLGAVLGIAVGAVVMLVIGVNYRFLMERYPHNGGTLTYAGEIFGPDHGFLSSWFLILVYVAIIWANATAIPLISRYLLGGVFQFGFHYEVLGFDVYLGEALISAAAVIVVGAVLIAGKKLAVWLQIVMSIVLFGGVAFVFVIAAVKDPSAVLSAEPAYSPLGGSELRQVLELVALAPWAFVGFESISHSAQELRFSIKKSLGIMALALFMGAGVYIMLALLAASAAPEGYSNWVEYISALGSESGIRGLPTFFAAQTYLGPVGTAILSAAALSGILTGLLGNMLAASRLLWSMSDHEMLPEWFHKLTKNGSPQNCIVFLTGISLFVPLVGRTAIGWTVDVSSIGATVAYAYTSAATLKLAYTEKKRFLTVTGALGALVSLMFFIYFMSPSFWGVSAMATESYLLLIIWSILGFIFFRYVFSLDSKKNFGKSAVVWITLAFFVFLTSMLWIRESTHYDTAAAFEELREESESKLLERGVGLTDEDVEDYDNIVATEMEKLDAAHTRTTVVQTLLVASALAIIFNIYGSVSRRERDMEVKKIQAEESNKAKSRFLSNMSHDIRTPMNAIVGYTDLARQEKDVPPNVAAYLEKIDASSQHMLALINDVLEMSRIESGKMQLILEDTDLVEMVDEVGDMFRTQMEVRGLRFTVDTAGVEHRYAVCDHNRLDRIMLNLVSNAMKFTPSGGSVRLVLRETGFADGFADYELTVKDTGIGMSEEFAKRIFEAFEREEKAEKRGIQGTGLGMSITKSFVELMGGSIRLDTAEGAGSEFTVSLRFETCGEVKKAGAESGEEVVFDGVRLLLAEDNEINREIANEILTGAGFVVDNAENGREALETVENAPAGTYAAVLMDMQMPVMDGLSATRAIRALSDPEKAAVPIIAMTANAFREDIQAARDAGMNAHVAKPVDVKKLMDTLREHIRK